MAVSYLVSFHYGPLASYDSTGNHSYGLYFTTDTNELYLNGYSIGNKVSSITYGDSLIQLVMQDGSTIVVSPASSTSAGIMTAEDKLILDALSTLASEDNSIVVTTTDDSVDLSVNIDDSTIKQDDNNLLYVVNALSNTEKSWIEELLFDTLFTVSISRSNSSVVFSGSSYTVTWTLTCLYDGTNVDLDSAPSGWTWSSTGVYTKTTTVTTSTGSSVSSGSASCTYTSSTGTSGTKTASSVSCTNIKYSYIYTTTDSSLSSLDGIDFDEATRMSSSNTVSGTYSITFTEGQYCYFIIANTSSVSSITQLGLNYVNDYTSMTRTNYGTYKVYRSTNAMSASTQEITVA